MNCETASRATDLEKCCGKHPQRVRKPNGKNYIECPSCCARTIPATPAAATLQWLVMTEAFAGASKLLPSQGIIRRIPR